MTPLHHFGEFFRRLFTAVPPEVARGLFILVFVILLVWVLRLPRSRTTPPAGEKGGSLKYWAALALIVQILLYLFI